jgi:glucose-6-phosphate isomerase
MPENLSIRTHAQMNAVLLDPNAPAPETFYFMLRGGVTVGNITILEPGRAGEEYIKTLGHYHAYEFNETYRVLDGEALMLLQKRKRDGEGKPLGNEIEDFKVVKLSAGSEITLPPDYGHVLVNIGKTFLITRDDSPSDPAATAVRPHADYAPISALRGLAFYCVERNGAPALVKNPNYTFIGTTDFAGLILVA